VVPGPAKLAGILIALAAALLLALQPDSPAAGPGVTTADAQASGGAR
jgi:hypothetical protein